MGKKVGVMSRQAPKDFVKVKNKVGKKKKAAQNETRTDFRVRQVHVPAQNALEEKGEEVTHRRLGLLELLAHMQHHSGRVRRDALRGLQELCATHDGVLGKNLARIVEATTTAAFDTHAEVRQAFRAFQSWLMQALPEGGLAAFAPTLALQVRSALSHVNSEVRGDGLVLLELYVARLGESQVLTQAEALRVIKILCQMQTHSETVLSCLHRLLQPPPSSSAAASEAPQALACSEAQTPLQALLDGRYRQPGGDAGAGAGASGGEGQAEGEEMEVEAGADSPVWAFCLRMWMQSGEASPGVAAAGGSKSAAEAAAKPGWTKLRCAAVLEKALQAYLQGASRGVALQPSASQVATLAGIVRRGEWPLRAHGSASLRQLAESANLCMARVCALLVVGGAPADANKYNLNLLANAVLGLIEEVATAPLASAAAAGGLAAASAPASGSGGGPGSEVRVLTGAAALAYALRTLDLLWACSPQAAAAAGPGAARAGASLPLPLGPQEMDRLAAATAQLLEGGGEAEAVGASTILSVPLAASLLGLRPSAAAAARPPQALRAAWSEALAAAGEPCLAAAVEASRPGTAVAWVTAWPKLLWYLGKSDPALSAFILALLLELAKQAVQLGSLHAQLFAQVCPLLVPFLAGRPGVDRSTEPPPLALLPAGPDGPQGLAAMLLHHFPKLTEPLLAVLAKLVCRWSDVGAAGDGDAAAELPPARLGPECCEIILEAVLRGPCADAAQLLPTRLGVALTVLTAGSVSPASGSRAERAERAALRFADLVAGWLMDEPPGSGGALLGRASELSYDGRRRLAFQSLAWPLCMRVSAAAAALAPRALCFLFFCAARLPRSCAEACGAAPPVEDLGWRSFLCELFAELLVKGGGRALQPEAQGTGLAAALATPLCEPSRSGGLPHAGGTLDPQRCLARLFVTLWMRAVAAPQRMAAYELLAKLCAERLVAPEQAAAGQGVAGAASADEERAAAVSAVAMVLAEAIAYRNEHSLPTGSWGGVGQSMVADPSLATCGAEALQARLRGALPAGAARRPRMAPGLAALEAALPLL